MSEKAESEDIAASEAGAVQQDSRAASEDPTPEGATAASQNNEFSQRKEASQAAIDEEEAQEEEEGTSADESEHKEEEKNTSEKKSSSYLLDLCKNTGISAGAAVTEAVIDDEGQLQRLVAHGCSLVGNLEVAAVSSSVRAQVQSEASEATWRQTLEDSAREATTTMDEVQKRWKEAVEQPAPEDMAEHLRQLQAECDALLSKKKLLVSRLSQEIEAVDEMLLEEVVEHRQKREELLRRLAEHTRELCAASRDTVKHLQAVTEEQRKDLAQRCSELLDAALAEFSEDLEELMRGELDDADLRQQQRVTAQLVPVEGGELLEELETKWQQQTSAACDLRVQRCLEKPRLLYRLRLQQQQQQAAAEQLNHTRRLIIGLRPQLQKHRRQREKEKREKEKRKGALLQQVKDQQHHLQQLQQRISSRREHLQKVQKGISAMHCEALASLVHQIQEVEQHIEVQVLGRDRLPAGDDALELRTLLLQEPLFVQPAVSTAMSIIRGRPARMFHPALDDDSASVSPYEPTELEKTFLLGMVEAAAFLVPQERLPQSNGENAPEDNAVLQLEHIFREVGVNSDADMHNLLALARSKKPGISHLPLEQTQRVQQTEFSESDTVHSSEGFTNSEVLDILTYFTKCRRRPSVPQNEKPEVSTPANDNVGTCNGDDRWEAFLEDVCATRERTWRIAGTVVEQYLAELQGRKKDEKTVAALQQQVSELQRLLI